MSVDRILSVESGGNPYAANPNSTARGLGQFIERTWLDMMARHRPDLITGMGRDQILELRNDPALSREMTEAYSNENKRLLGKAGVPVTDGTAYLAHFAGPQGAIKVLQADPTAMAGDILGPAVVKANPFLAKMTAGDLAAWADKKMGVSSPNNQISAPTAISAPISAASAPPAMPQGILAAQQPQQPQGALAPAQEQGGLLNYAPQGGGQMPKPMAPLEHLPVPIPQTLYQQAKRKAPSGAFSFRG